MSRNVTIVERNYQSYCPAENLGEKRYKKKKKERFTNLWEKKLKEMAGKPKAHTVSCLYTEPFF